VDESAHFNGLYPPSHAIGKEGWFYLII